MRVRDRRRARFEDQDSSRSRAISRLRVRRSIGILGRAGGGFGSSDSAAWRFVFFGNRGRRSRKQRTRQSRGQFFVRERPWRGRRGGSFTRRTKNVRREAPQERTERDL